MLETIKERNQMSLFSIRLRQLRNRVKKSQAEVAEMIGVSRSSYAGYETLDIIPPYGTIRKLAELFNVSVDYLMGQTNFENYEFDKTGVPDIIDQLTMILDELDRESVRVKVYDRDLTMEEKKMLIPYVDGCLNAVKMISKIKQQ